ncbi:hypothetical protein GCM10027060_18120 [Nesterenkonia halophila]|uniref:CPBP family intramembrane glutamic endopeptidase n=1 Tax=Nesterenkonia halophila TaxID=302044 RepID=UPI001291A096|nr:CPBP family intramembrane glutamic endopeptidase [Nesterenkonia halophila]
MSTPNDDQQGRDPRETYRSGPPVPPPGPHPYGAPEQPDPQGPPQGPPPGAPQGQPGGQPGWWTPPQPPRPAPSRHRQRDAEPGRFSWWDLGAVVLYLATFMVGGAGLVATLLPPVRRMMTSGDADQMALSQFLVNAGAYVLMALVVLLLAGPAMMRAVRTFAPLWWLKLLLVPVSWLAIILVNATLVSLISDQPQVSANQQAIEQMLGAVPYLGALVVLGLLGPLVEEFFFRHLLIGKLSRHLNIWICAGISVAVFPMIHFIPALIGPTDDLSIATLVPYVTMGLVFTLGYILSGRSLLYSWLLHAFNNSMAVSLQYLLQGPMKEFTEQLPDTMPDGGVAVLGLLGATVAPVLSPVLGPVLAG